MRQTANGRSICTPKRFPYHQLKSLLATIGMHPDHLSPRHTYLKNDIAVAGCADQAGTVRFGDDPASAVLNADCRAHDVDTLYVNDTLARLGVDAAPQEAARAT